MHPQSTRVHRLCQHCGASFTIKASKARIGKGRFCSNACKAASRVRPAADRFWLRVNKSSGRFWNGTECWEWTGPHTRGYGSFALRHGVKVSAHRFAYTLAHGTIPDDLFVCHHCDNKVCVRDEHHFLGTHSDNMRDCVAKGRFTQGFRPGVGGTKPVRGEQNHATRLTAEQIVAIRRAYAAGGISHRALAARYGMKHVAIGQILRRETWAHIPD